MFCSVIVEKSLSVVYNGIENLGTNERFWIKVLNFYSSTCVSKLIIVIDIFRKLKHKGHRAKLVRKYILRLWYRITDIVQISCIYLLSEDVRMRYDVVYAVHDLPLNII